MITCVIALFVCTDAALALDFPLECTYVANAPTAELEPHARCAVITGVSLKISGEHLSKMSYATNGLATALIDGHWYYVRPSGDLLKVVTFDNGADYFSEGLTRSLVGGKIAYFNSNFHQVISPKYDWGWPFEAGRALVCIGCKPAESEKDGHSSVDGGRWGFIDKSGKEVVRVKLTKAEALSR